LQVSGESTHRACHGPGLRRRPGERGQARSGAALAASGAKLAFVADSSVGAEIAREAGGLLGHARFRRYSIAKLSQLVGQNAIIYGLFIAVIEEQESSLATSAFVLASVLPSIVLSLPGGLFADRLPKKLVLVGTLLLRMLVVYWFIQSEPKIGAVIGLTFVLWTAYQFYAPAENAAVLAVVPREKLAQAASFLQALSLVGQLVGAGLVAPLALWLFGEDGLYLIVLAAFAAAVVVFTALPDLSPARERAAGRQVALWRSLPAGYRAIRADESLASLTVMRVLLDTGMLMFVVATPVFIEEVLDSGAENAIYIAIPGALGLAAGLVLAPLLLGFVTPRSLALAGFMGFTGVLLLLPFVDELAPEITSLFGPPADFVELFGVSEAIAATVVLLPIAGLGSSLVHVAARTEVYRRAPAGMVAQVFATQSALGSLAALVPTIVSGVMLDVLPVRLVLVVIGVVLAAGAVLAWQRAG
jgi:Major Facilitator Superfamily